MHEPTARTDLAPAVLTVRQYGSGPRHDLGALATVPAHLLKSVSGHGGFVQRLKTRTQFQAALAGPTVARTAHFALHRLALEAPAVSLARLGDSGDGPGSGVRFVRPPLFAVHDAWLGALIPKRWARRAVTRNAVRRQVYAVASAAAPLPVAAHVVRLRSAFDRKQFVSASSDELKHAVRLELQQLFGRAADVPLAAARRPAAAVAA